MWVDTAIVKLREIARLDAMVSTLRKQETLLENELRATSQRVNLFSKCRYQCIQTSNLTKFYNCSINPQRIVVNIVNNVFKCQLLKCWNRYTCDVLILTDNCLWLYQVIGVFLGDQQTAAVVRGKISKKKLVEAAK